MNRRKKPNKRGFSKSASAKTKKKRPKPILIKDIADISRQVERAREIKRKKPQALEKFLKLVYENDLEKLTAYFANYGIDPEFTVLNLDSLIAEEFEDLSS